MFYPSDWLIFATLGGASTLYACWLDRHQADYMPERAHVATAVGVAGVLLAVGLLPLFRGYTLGEWYVALWIAFAVAGLPIALWRRRREAQITAIRLQLQSWAAVEARRRAYHREEPDGDTGTGVAAQPAAATRSNESGGAAHGE